MPLRCGKWTFCRRGTSLPRWVSWLCVILTLGLSTLILYHMVYTLELQPWNPGVERWCDHEETPQTILDFHQHEITVVTMFIELGVFKKGEETFGYYSSYKYKRWMRTFSKMANRVIAYIEKDSDIEYFRKIRSCLPDNFTKIIKINRNKLPSFQHLAAICHIYSNPSYPKYYPNTVYPEYTCAMHAKYDILEMSCLMDYFKTPYVAWVDIGFFRNLDGSDYSVFKLLPPKSFSPAKIGFSQAWNFEAKLSPDLIMKNKKVWVAGGMVLATKQSMLNFIKDYKAAVSELLSLGLSNTDQEVIYSMQSTQMYKPHFMKITAYSCHQGQYGLYGSDARYFCLGYMCKSEGSNVYGLEADSPFF